MIVGQVSTRSVVVIEPTASLVDAAKLMRAKHVGALIVVESPREPREPLGIITDRDIVLGAVAEDAEDLVKLEVGDLMSRELVTVTEDESLFGAAEKMLRNGVRRLPVVDADKVLSGIITLDDLIDLFADQLKSLAGTLQTERSRERFERRSTR
jgi:CBS domain-containing protein